MDISENPVFITSVYSGDLKDIDYEKSVKEIYKIKENDPGRKMPEYTGWHSNQVSVKDVENTEQVLSIVKNVYSAAQHVSTIMGYQKELIFNACWFNINYPGNFNEQHRHPWTHLSAVYYIKAEKNSGKISFIRDGRAEDYFPANGSNNPHIAPRSTHEAKTGRFYIFPSYLDHKVDPNFSDEERISMAFNFSFGS
jgi:uncharacterized protein (TIGR02466 family)